MTVRDFDENDGSNGHNTRGKNDMIVVIDYDIGNIKSVANMFKKIGFTAEISSDLTVIGSATKLVLPGVGAFDTGMKHLQASGIQEVLHEKVIKQRIPILGICLGMQLFSKSSQEGILDGLGWLDAKVIRFEFSGDQKQIRVPHMGWNTIKPLQSHPLLQDLEHEARFYFVHSYHIVCVNSQDVMAQTHYGYDFTSIVFHNNIMGVQFHPEKSHKFGMSLLKNFAEL